MSKKPYKDFVEFLFGLGDQSLVKEFLDVRKDELLQNKSQNGVDDSESELECLMKILRRLKEKENVQDCTKLKS